jgi:7,8-dihydropterin-6-yl-methyl-4-(beta-D-ribofuranosyl)aminobenzene 5'-phosphate synthase
MTTSSIWNLYDAFGKRPSGAVFDFGFSALIEYRGKRILFDAGAHADIFATNAAALGVEIESIDVAIVSHVHVDHVSGFDHVLRRHPKLKMYAPEDVALGAHYKASIGGSDPELLASLPREQRYFDGERPEVFVRSSGRFWNANLEFVDQSREILPGVTLIATGSPLLGTFSRYPPHEATPRLTPMPELSLSLATGAGEALVVACSHSEVTSIAGAAQAHLGRPIDLLMGGFHLGPYSEEAVQKTAATLSETFAVKRVAPAHCTGHLGFKVFRDVFSGRCELAGLGSRIEF